MLTFLLLNLKLSCLPYVHRSTDFTISFTKYGGKEKEAQIQNWDGCSSHQDFKIRSILLHLINMSQGLRLARCLTALHKDVLTWSPSTYSLAQIVIFVLATALFRKQIYTGMYVYQYFIIIVLLRESHFQLRLFS